jgi:hypothetical protein
MEKVTKRASASSSVISFIDPPYYSNKLYILFGMAWRGIHLSGHRPVHYTLFQRISRHVKTYKQSFFPVVPQHYIIHCGTKCRKNIIYGNTMLKADCLHTISGSMLKLWLVSVYGVKTSGRNTTNLKPTKELNHEEAFCHLFTHLTDSRVGICPIG